MRAITLFLATASLLVPASPAAAAAPFPSVLPLPDGFRPEGIVRGHGNILYVGNFDNGSVYQLDARTGAGSIVVPALPGRAAIGMKRDGKHLFVAGGGTGHAYVYDLRTGASLADYTLAASGAFINDVVLTRDAAYFTDSFQSVLYVLPLDCHGLPDQDDLRVLPLTGDFVTVPNQFNANGIEASANGRSLIVVNSFTGKLFRVDARTGVADEIELAGGTAANGDGLVLQGRTLYVIQNGTNQVAVVSLSASLRSGVVEETLADPDLDFPATGVLLRGALYIANLRITTPYTPTTPFWVTRVELND